MMTSSISHICSQKPWPNPEKEAGLALLTQRGYVPVTLKGYKDLYQAPAGSVLYWRKAVEKEEAADHAKVVAAALAEIEATA